MALCAPLLLLTSTALAQPIEWTRDAGAEGCIDAAALNRALLALDGRRARGGESQLRGEVSRAGDAYVVRMRVVDDQGRALAEREVRADVPDCRSLDDAIVVIATLLLDAEAARHRAEALAASIHPETQARLELQAGVGIGTGPLPGPSLRARLGLMWSRRRLWLGADFALERGSSIKALEGELRSYALWGEVFGCGRALGDARRGLGLCGVFGAGRLLVRTRGLLAANGDQRLTHARAGLGLRVQLDLG
ncbi:MAG: hypothetical protein GXP55_12335, partial [Deltaproteobacteria bacterium]|nr:hypothetical protein [Deltaproteobacteria bacterium]